MKKENIGQVANSSIILLNWFAEKRNATLLMATPLSSTLLT